MTRDQMIKIGMVVCAVVLLCAVIATSTGWFGAGGFASYANAEKYTSGNAEIRDTVKNLEVNWTSGSVNVAYHAENTVKLEETAKRSLSDDEKLQWWMDGDTLRVQFTKPGIRWNMPGKELTITLPDGIALENARIQATSAEIRVPALKAEKMELCSTSGDIDAAAEADTATVESTSGDVKLKLSGKAGSVRIGSTSGDIILEAEKTGSINAGSTSGRIGIKAAEAEKVKAGSTSGNIDVTLWKVFSLDIGATSGDVTAALNETPGFTAEIGTVSGRFTSSLALTKDGSRYVCGDGSTDVKIGTTSGDVRIEAAEEE